MRFPNGESQFVIFPRFPQRCMNSEQLLFPIPDSLDISRLLAAITTLGSNTGPSDRRGPETYRW